MWGGRDRGELGEVLARVQLKAPPQAPAHIHCLPEAWMGLRKVKTNDVKKDVLKIQICCDYSGGLFACFYSQVWRGRVEGAQQTSN